MITLLDYFPSASHDSDKYQIPLSSLGITTPTLSNVYFGLLYKIFGYYHQEIRISLSDSNRALLTGDIPLLSIRDTSSFNEYSTDVLNPYETWSEQFAIRFFFKILTNDLLLSTSFSMLSEMTQLISWNESNALIYRYLDYFANWENISGKEILSYLLHIGLVFRDSKTFTIIYNTLPINTFEESEIITYTEYRFYVTFKLAIPEAFTIFTAQEVV